MATVHPLWLANQPAHPGPNLVVTHKYTGAVLATVARADGATLERAIAAASQARPAMAQLPAHRRAAILRQVQAGIEARREDLAQLLCAEGGKPIRDARGEVQRAIDTFRIAAEEATRQHGEYLNLDENPGAEGVTALVKRVPIGACAFISPFNFPLNLVAHKVAPAIAAGCPFVLKPASSTPLAAMALGEILASTDLPAGAFSILPMDRETAEGLVGDPRLNLLSFTGSAEVGWAMKSRAGKQKVVLELGGNAACVVDAGADVARVVARLAVGGFAQSGQSCISVQRILAHRSLFEALKAGLVAAVAALPMGDPALESTVVGPLIAEAEAERLVRWIEEARAAGAEVLTGGGREGALVQPTVVVGAPTSSELQAEEAFGPVVCLDVFDDFAEALERVNASRFGLQAGVFTPRLDHAFAAFERLEVGGVIINDVPAVRVDAMPYGGVKDSGLGREGVRSALHAMTEPRLMLLREPGRLSGAR